MSSSATKGIHAIEYRFNKGLLSLAFSSFISQRTFSAELYIQDEISEPLIPPNTRSKDVLEEALLSLPICFCSCPGENCHHSSPRPLMPPLAVFKGVITHLSRCLSSGQLRRVRRGSIHGCEVTARSPGTVNQLVVYLSPISLLILPPSLSHTLSHVLAPSSGDTFKKINTSSSSRPRTVSRQRGESYLTETNEDVLDFCISEPCKCRRGREQVL